MTEEREKRAVVRSLPRSVLPHPRRPGARVDPFDQWSSYPNLVEAFIDTIAEKAPVSPCDETLASIVSGLLEGTGCAIVRVEPESEKPEGIAVTGTWESANLSDVLGSSGFDWVFALDRAPAVVARQRESMRIRALRRWGKTTATAVAFPTILCDRGVGIVLVTYESRRTFGPTFLAAAKLLAGTVGMQLAIEEFRERTHAQAERLGRLTSEVERMGILLRRG